MEETFVNKVAQSGLVTLDLVAFYPTDEVVEFDLKPFLFMEMILKEKDFREKLKGWDWSFYVGKHVAVHCSADAIIPVWAYMLVATHLQPVAGSVQMGDVDDVRRKLLLDAIAKIEPDEYADQRVVVKGCGDIPVAEEAYLAITAKLAPWVKSIMYGEPCSTVPIYKRKA